jgi:hypothetical protein
MHFLDRSKKDCSTKVADGAHCNPTAGANPLLLIGGSGCSLGASEPWPVPLLATIGHDLWLVFDVFNDQHQEATGVTFTGKNRLRLRLD